MTNLKIVQDNRPVYVKISSLEKGTWWRDMDGKIGIASKVGPIGMFLDGTTVYHPCDYMVEPLGSVSIYVNDDTE